MSTNTNGKLMKTKKFAERFKTIIDNLMENKKFSSYRSISEKAGIHNSNITNFISGRTKAPDHKVLSKLSLVLGYPDDFLSQLYLYCEGINKFDPEISYQAKQLMLKQANLTLKEIFNKLLSIIYGTQNKEKQKQLLADDFKFAWDIFSKAYDQDLPDDYSTPETVINFIFNPCYNSDQERIIKTFAKLMWYSYHIETSVLNKRLKHLLPKELESNKKLSIDTQKTLEPFRYDADHYEQRPVFKATGGKLKQYITDGFTGNSERQEWGYFKGMPNAFFVEVEGNSMAGSGIKDKDYCLINPHASLGDGDICLAINGNTEATIKKFKKTTQGIMLTPSNPDFEPIFIPAPDAEHWHFYKVIESRHKF